MDHDAKQKMVSKIVHEEYSRLTKEEKNKIKEKDLEEKYLVGVDAFQNFRHARNLIKNDINQMLVEEFLRQTAMKNK